nr:flavin reductase family protein [Bacteroidota bacterium]
MHNEIDPFDHMNDILKALKKGILITTKSSEKVNCMTIAWGQIGIEWNKLIFTVFVRDNRFTHEMLARSEDFTINIPTDKSVRRILAYCGTKTGRDVDKIKELGLTIVEGQNVNAPAIKELPMTLECKIIYRQHQDKEAIPKNLQQLHYPADVPGSFHGANQNFHTMFFGEIVSAYIISE